MIIRFPIKSDTYITNLNTQYVEGINTNVGHAATLDLFKLYNENKYCQSKAYIEFDIDDTNDNGVDKNVTNDCVIFFTDAFGKELKLKFKTNVAPADSGWDNDVLKEFYEIGMSGVAREKYSESISNAINIINEEGLIKLKSYFTENYLIVTQEEKGEIGDQKFDISQLIAASSKVSPDEQGQHYFSRIEYSYILLKLDKDEILKWIPNSETGAFTSGEYSTNLILKDVSTGLSKPKGYQLEYYELSKSFDEGIGKDTASYSDTGFCNFISLSDNATWDIQGFISDGDIDTTVTGLSNYIETGNEDISLDITGYISKIISNNDYDNKGIIIGFKKDYIFNNKSYFVKRLGSRHLLNKTLVPYVDVVINDTKYEYSDYDIKKREFKVSESSFKLYYLNYLDAEIKFKVTEESNPDVPVEIISSTALLQEIDFRGNDINGLLSYEILLENGENGEGFLEEEYKNFAILNSGKKTFKLSWLDANDNVISKEDIDIVYYDYDSKTNISDLYVTIKFDRELTEHNTDYLMTAYFIDLKEKTTASRIAYNLKSKNLGEVYYEIADESGKKLISQDRLGTKLKFNGENYQGRVFIPELFKNSLLKFKLYYNDNFGILKTIENNIKFKVK